MADSDRRTSYVCPYCKGTDKVIKKNFAGQDVISTCQHCLVMRDARESAKKKEQSRG